MADWFKSHSAIFSYMENPVAPFVLRGNAAMEQAFSIPQFSWQGNTYNFIPSVSKTSLQLDTGGFKVIKKLTATVKKFLIDNEGNTTPIFANGYPLPQQIIAYVSEGTFYRIQSVDHDPINATFSFEAYQTTAGL